VAVDPAETRFIGEQIRKRRPRLAAAAWLSSQHVESHFFKAS